MSLINPSYDFDGNATANPLPIAPTTNSTLTYDAENRLTSTTVGGITTTQQFDATGRRMSKTTGTTIRLYLYDAWNVIAEYSSSTLPTPTSTLLKTRLWGPDLSGSMQGAGGVGGLLCESSSQLPTPSSFFPTYDGNGNISEYLTTTGTIAAHFEYDAFGNTTVNTDTTNQFTYKFSTKSQDVETGLYYYGYRYYDPVGGRWINRDPIGEQGGVNLYGMVDNDGINLSDLLGFSPMCPDCCKSEGIAALRAWEAVVRSMIKLGNHYVEIYEKRIPDLIRNSGGLPETTPGDGLKPSESIQGHRRILKEAIAAGDREHKRFVRLNKEAGSRQVALSKCLKVMDPNCRGSPPDVFVLDDPGIHDASLDFFAMYLGLRALLGLEVPALVPVGGQLPKPITEPGRLPVPAHP